MATTSCLTLCRPNQVSLTKHVQLFVVLRFSCRHKLKLFGSRWTDYSQCTLHLRMFPLQGLGGINVKNTYSNGDITSLKSWKIIRYSMQINFNSVANFWSMIFLCMHSHEARISLNLLWASDAMAIHIRVNIESTKPVPGSMLPYHQWVCVEFTWGQFRRKCPRCLSLMCIWTK